MPYLSKRIRSKAWLVSTRKTSPYFEPVVDEHDDYLALVTQESDDVTAFPDREDLAGMDVSGAALDERIRDDLDQNVFAATGTLFGHDLLLLCGQEIASVVLFPELVAAALQACGLAWEGTIHVYLPTCDSLCVATAPFAEEVLPGLRAAASSVTSQAGLSEDPARALDVAMTVHLEGARPRGTVTITDLRTLSPEAE